MLKRWIIKILIRLLEPHVDYKDIDDKRIYDWLSETAKDLRFHEYFRKRDLTLLKSFGQGLDREHYLMVVGQRLELLQMLSAVDGANKTKEKEIQQRQREAERSVSKSQQHSP